MKLVKITFALLILVVVGLATFSYWIFYSVNAPHQHNKADHFIAIEKGSTPKQIIGKLSNDGVIASYAATLAYLRVFGDSSKMQAGEYQFPSPITPLQVLKELEKGETQTTKLVIPEGFTRFDIAKRMASAFGSHDIALDENEVLSLMNDVSLIKDIAPTATNLEGYMYPSTYTFPKKADAKYIIKTMVDQFRKVWKPEWTATAQSLGKTPHEIVTIASLIETETGVESESADRRGHYQQPSRQKHPARHRPDKRLYRQNDGHDGTARSIRATLRSIRHITPGSRPVCHPARSRLLPKARSKRRSIPDQTTIIFYVRNVDAQ